MLQHEKRTFDFFQVASIDGASVSLVPHLKHERDARAILSRCRYLCEKLFIAVCPSNYLE